MGVAADGDAEAAAQAQVRDLEAHVVGVHQKVLRLQVAMHDAVLVAVRHALDQLVHEALQSDATRRPISDPPFLSDARSSPHPRPQTLCRLLAVGVTLNKYNNRSRTWDGCASRHASCEFCFFCPAELMRHVRWTASMVWKWSVRKLQVKGPGAEEPRQSRSCRIGAHLDLILGHRRGLGALACGVHELLQVGSQVLKDLRRQSGRRHLPPYSWRLNTIQDAAPPPPPPPPPTSKARTCTGITPSSPCQSIQNTSISMCQLRIETPL